MVLTRVLRLACAGAVSVAVACGAPLKSAGPLAFGPDGVLFIGDTAAANIVAVQTRDTKAAAMSAKVDIQGINQKLAAMLGTTAGDILINDVKVNPVSKNIYISMSRGRGPEAIPVIMKVDTTGAISEFALDKLPTTVLAIPNAPNAVPGGRNPRLDTITQIAYLDGNVLIAGLSNEEFSSNLRTVPYPFQAANSGASVEIFHGAHGRYETNSPVRTFVPMKIQNKQHIVAAYTCTPLVTIPMNELKPGAKVKGTTISELGAGNRPLDMIAYRKDDHDYILMANSSHGLLKLTADHLETYRAITAQTERTGVPIQSLASLTGVKHLTSLDAGNALILSEANGTMDLRSIPLP